ncbi:acidic leucine-rich nuclear phosphoprotein 32 family member E-like [Montipora capricornis]|uniref:acidic leucine-rich nuclear phosphoprotein 32 family member E-like n=1 Tax=Montipora capricornis TaxID=246305 RepID=UPI0035F1F72F
MKILVLSIVIGFVSTVGLATPDNQEDKTSQDELLRDAAADIESYNAERHPYLDSEDENSKLEDFSNDEDERDSELEDDLDDYENGDYEEQSELEDEFESDENFAGDEGDDRDANTEENDGITEERVSDIKGGDNKIDANYYEEGEEHSVKRLSDPDRFGGRRVRGDKRRRRRIFRGRKPIYRRKRFNRRRKRLRRGGKPIRFRRRFTRARFCRGRRRR